MKTKIKTKDIYNSCSGKKGSGCDAIDYILPYMEHKDTIVGNCNGSQGCNISKSYKIPFDKSISTDINWG